MTWRLRTRPAAHDAGYWAGLAALGAGAALTAYFLDPDKGSARRRRLVDRAGHFVRAARKRVARTARYMRNTAVARGRHLILDGQPKFAEGRMLLDRVESELFEDPTIPRGRMNLEVDGMVVVLRGELDSVADIERVERRVSRVPGVLGLVSHLHLPGSPAPNKAASLMAVGLGER